MCSARRIPYGRILGFIGSSLYFSFKQILNCNHEARRAPFQTHYFSEIVVTPGIEIGLPDADMQRTIRDRNVKF
jgi:hypothetical protein